MAEKPSYSMLQNQFKRLVITGPESSGKTTLAETLSAAVGIPRVPEFVRAYFERKGTPQYVEADLRDIAIGQNQLELETAANWPIFAPKCLICDTDGLTIKIWSEVKYGRCHHLITDLWQQQTATASTLYLLCSPEGIEWAYDPLRENPNDRDALFDLYASHLRTKNLDFHVLNGDKQARLQKAIEIYQAFAKPN